MKQELDTQQIKAESFSSAFYTISWSVLKHTSRVENGTYLSLISETLPVIQTRACRTIV